MSKGVRIIFYCLVGFFSFLLFLYLTFPFDILKDRMVAAVERGLKGRFEVTIESITPHLLAGVTLKKVALVKREEEGSYPVWSAEKVKLKVSLFSLLLNRPKVKFDIVDDGGEIEGAADLGKEEYKINAALNNVNLARMTYFSSKLGLNIESDIDGKFDMILNPEQVIRSSGSLSIEPDFLRMKPSKVKVGPMGELDLPEIVIGEGKSLISAELKGGAIRVSSFRLEKGDFSTDIKGAVYLSTNASNFRLNLRGTFGFSEKVGQALPFLFIIEKQKSEDGTYPITVAGRLAKPQIKIGDFIVPF